MIRAKRNTGQGTVPGDGEKAPSKGEEAGVRYASPHERRDKAPPTEHCHLRALPKKVGCLRTVGKWHRKVANKQIARVEKTGNTQKKNHVSYAVHVLLCPFRHGVWLITLPAGGSVLGTSATFDQNLWTKSQNSTDFAQNQWSFFCPCATWRQSLRSAGQK